MKKNDAFSLKYIKYKLVFICFMQTYGYMTLNTNLCVSDICLGSVNLVFQDGLETPYTPKLLFSVKQ